MDDNKDFKKEDLTKTEFSEEKAFTSASDGQPNVYENTDNEDFKEEDLMKTEFSEDKVSTSASDGQSAVYENTDIKEETPRVIGEVYLHKNEEDHDDRFQSSRSLIINRSVPNTSPIDVAIFKKNIVPTTLKIGFIGLGLIGLGAVKNLMKTGHQVVILEQNNVFLSELTEAGAHTAQTPFDLGIQCDVVFNCSSDEDEVKSIVFGQQHFNIMDGFLASFHPAQKGYVEMSPVSPSVSEDIYITATEKGVKYLEAPVIGSKSLADSGDLLIVTAGDRRLFEICETAFQSMAATTYFLSENIRSASSMCAIVRMFTGTTCAALAEAVEMSNRLNVDSSIFMELLGKGPMNCPFVKEKAEAMFTDNFTTEVALKHQQADLKTAIDLGASVGQPLVLSATANEVFKKARLERYSDHDVSAVFKVV